MIGKRVPGQEGRHRRRQVTGHSRARLVSPNIRISARTSSGFSLTPCTSPSSSRPDSSSDCCAAAAADGSACSSRSATANSAAAWRKASIESTPGTLAAWHRPRKCVSTCRNAEVIAAKYVRASGLCPGQARTWGRYADEPGCRQRGVEPGRGALSTGSPAGRFRVIAGRATLDVPGGTGPVRREAARG